MVWQINDNCTWGVYLGDYYNSFCIGFLFLHNNYAGNSHLTSFSGSGVWAQMSLALSSGSYKAMNKMSIGTMVTSVWASLASSLRFWQDLFSYNCRTHGDLLLKASSLVIDLRESLSCLLRSFTLNKSG